MKKLIPKIIDIICFLGGSILAIYCGSYILFPRDLIGVRFIGGSNILNYRIGFLIGVNLIVLGFLIRSWLKDNRNLSKK